MSEHQMSEYNPDLPIEDWQVSAEPAQTPPARRIVISPEMTKIIQTVIITGCAYFATLIFSPKSGTIKFSRTNKGQTFSMSLSHAVAHTA